MSALAQVVGYNIPDKPVAWNKRDLLMYAIGVGAKNDEYPFIYELDPNFSALPTYPVVLDLKEADTDINLFRERIQSYPVPGMPPMIVGSTIHASQSIETLKPLPLVSGDGWKYKTRYTGVSENKSGIVVTYESTLVDPNGVTYAQLFSQNFHLGATSTGEKFSKSIAGPPQAKPIPKDRNADWVFQEQTTREQALIYRLSGNYDPLHVDPKVGKGAGFGGIILHGLSTYGFAARAALKLVGGGDPNSLKLFSARFTAPVKPGDKLETSFWEVGQGPNGTVELAFETKNLATGKVALGGGLAYVVKKSSARL